MKPDYQVENFLKRKSTRNTNRNAATALTPASVPNSGRVIKESITQPKEPAKGSELPSLPSP